MNVSDDKQQQNNMHNKLNEWRKTFFTPIIRREEE
jgi:hypothetical protein